MSRQAAVNLVLLGTLVLLAAVAIVEPGKSRPPPPAPIAAIDAQAVARLVVERPGQPQVLLAREGGRWWMHAPYRGPADEDRVRALLELPHSRSTARLAVADLALARFGLAPPKAALVIDDLRLEIGDTQPLDGRRYVLAGDDVHLVYETVYHLLVSEAAEFLSPAIVEPGRELEALELPGRHIARGSDGAWVVTAGAPLPRQRLHALVEAWAGARARRVAPLGEGAPQGNVRITLDGGERIELGILATEPALVLGRGDRGVRYEMPAASATMLLPDSPSGAG